MVFADYTLGDALLTVLSIFFIIIWIWILIAILSDLFRDHEQSGWAKALWVLFLIFVPVLTALIYLIVRGHGMRERAIKQQAETQKHLDSYIRETAGTSSADELAKLAQLKQQGTISDAEFEQMKAKLVS